ncbi:MAG TPA: carboxypeptidase-like regulatory domain-containing protein [Bryobacteraceae bacterium]|nr:carboxypeptidase-like regulatory domain-containing protein [Bryobacteraceae bacterium]
MKRVLACLALASLRLGSQPADGGLIGVVSAPDTLPVPLAAVQLKNAETSALFNAVTTGKGEFALTNLPPGRYDFSVSSVRYFARFQKSGLVIQAGSPQRLDVRLGFVVMGGTPGEGHEPALSSLRRVAPRGPTPRMPDGKPDFSGVWSWPIPTDAGTAAFLPAGAPNGSLTPATYCLPHAVLWNNSFVKMVQTPKLMVILYDDDDPAYRQIYLDGRPHPKDEDPTWYGHAVGHWDGDTLVVDRVGFNGKGWLDPGGHRYTEQLHVVERYSRPDNGHLEVETTVDDPNVLKTPWISKRLSILAPEEDVREYACNENNVDPAHMKTGK